jgi:hypothetical protein
MRKVLIPQIKYFRQGQLVHQGCSTLPPVEILRKIKYLNKEFLLRDIHSL